MELSISLAIITLVFLLSASPIVRVPIGPLLAMYELSIDAERGIAVLLGAIGVTAARSYLAMAARRNPERSASAQATGVNNWLSKSGAFRRATFLAAAVPLIPGRILFPLLGASGAPIRFAALGCFIGQLPLLYFTTWISGALALWASDDNEQEAVLLLALFAVFLLVMRTLGQIDWAAWQQDRRLRWKVQDPPHT